MMTLDHPSNMQTVVHKLLCSLQNQWRDQVVNMQKKGQQIAKFQDLVKFVNFCAEATNNPVFSKAALERQAYPKEERKKKDYAKRSRFSTNMERVDFGIQFDGAGPSKRQKLCILCKNNHDLEECKNLSTGSVDEKKWFLRQNRLCFGC